MTKVRFTRMRVTFQQLAGSLNADLRYIRTQGRDQARLVDDGIQSQGR